MFYQVPLFPCFTTIFLPVIQSPRPHRKRCNPCCAIGSCERTRRRRPAMAQGSHGVCKGEENSREVTFLGVSHLENSTFLGHPPWFWLNFFWVKMISQRKWWMADGSLVSPGWIMARHFDIWKDFLGLDGFTVHPIRPQSNTSRSLDCGIGRYNPFKFGTVGLYHPSN